MSGKVQAFRAFGATLKNDQWSWSAISASGDAVLVLWKDELNYKSKPVLYDLFGHPELDKWMSRPGNRERIDVLRYARDKRNGEFRVIIAVAEDTNAETRKVRKPSPNAT